MNPEMTTDPLALLALAAIVWVAFGIQTWRRRPRTPPDAETQSHPDHSH